MSYLCLKAPSPEYAHILCPASQLIVYPVPVYLGASLQMTGVPRRVESRPDVNVNTGSIGWHSPRHRQGEAGHVSPSLGRVGWNYAPLAHRGTYILIY